MKKTDDKYFQDLLFSHFAGELTGEQEKELLAWLREDPSRKERFAEAADCWATAHVPLFMANKQPNYQDLSRQIIEQPTCKHRLPLRLILRNIAAALFVFVMIGSLSYYMGQKNERAHQMAIMNSQDITSEVKTPMGATTQITLPDGSKAWVNAGSTLFYHFNYGKGIREIQLDGEACFQVKPDQEHPFVIKSNNLDIKVLGTTFNVKSYANEDEVKVVLVTGSVAIHVDGAGDGEGDFTLVPDRMLTFHKESRNIEIAEFRAKDAIAWINGQLKFENCAFPVIAKDLERKFNVRIRIESKRLEKDIFSGSFSSDYSLEQILREVDVEKRYYWTYDKEVITIRDK